MKPHPTANACNYLNKKRKQPPSSHPKIASSNLHFTTILAHKPFFTVSSSYNVAVSLTLPASGEMLNNFTWSLITAFSGV